MQIYRCRLTIKRISQYYNNADDLNSTWIGKNLFILSNIFENIYQISMNYITTLISIFIIQIFSD